MIPSPSHPMSRIIRWGIKIKKFIERTNKMTRTVNRGIKGSEDMYVEVNNITFAEISMTTDENAVPHGSIINVINTGTCGDISSHSKITVVFVILRVRAIAAILSAPAHRIKE